MVMIGYAYERSRADLPAAERQLTEAGAEQVWSDCGPIREELVAMLDGAALRKGDVLLVRTKRRFGRLSWRVEEHARQVGYTIEVLGAAETAAEGVPARMGRPPIVDPDWPQAQRLTALVMGPGDRQHIEAEASKILGKAVRWWNVKDWLTSERRKRQAAENAERN